MTPKQQLRFIQMIGEMLLNGFSLQQSIELLDKINILPPVHLQLAKNRLKDGAPFSDILQQLGIKQEQLVQVELAETHGNLVETLKGIADQFRLMENFRKELQKAVSYPCLLLIFLIGILVSLRELVVPQLLQTEMVSATHWGIVLLQSLHLIFLGCFVGLILFLFLVYLRLKKWDAIRRSEWISKIHLIGRIYTLYQSAYLSLEIGKLFYEGLELKQIIHCLKETRKGSLLQLLAYRLTEGLETGVPLAEQFQYYPFLTEEFSKIVLQGEAKGNLGKELLFYSELTQKHFFQKMNRCLYWIQPILFLGIAGLILMIYAAILLPVYGNIEEVFT